jgi:hypothetical protein
MILELFFLIKSPEFLISLKLQRLDNDLQAPLGMVVTNSLEISMDLTLKAWQRLLGAHIYRHLMGDGPKFSP